MSRETVIGRKTEWEELEEHMEQSTAQLIVVYGRRRVGKTFLINEFFDNQFSFKVTGAYDEGESFQLENFVSELNMRTGKGYNPGISWRNAFLWLREYLEQLPKNQKRVVFFDEMPWFDTPGSSFLPVFEWFWNDWASAQKDLVFIVCGSATSWMINHFTKNKGGLFSRQTGRLYLKPFTLHETELFLKSKHIFWSRYQIAECYMIMGGIPYYLNLLSNRYSLSQNIDRMFFQDRGLLWDEFENLYRTLFSNSGSYIKVVEALSEKTGGLTRNEIAARTGFAGNGNLTNILNNLIYSGFVRASSFYGNKKKDTLYQLADYYTAFWFRFIRDQYGKDSQYWTHASDHPARRAWAGLTFEQLCKDHIAQIKQALGISGILTEESAWFTRGNQELNIPGAQIDLVIRRRDQVIHLCEIKFSVNEYIIDREYEMTLRNKMESFRQVTGTRDTLLLTMITTYGVKRNMYSDIARSQIVLEDLFEPAKWF